MKRDLKKTNPNPKSQRNPQAIKLRTKKREKKSLAAKQFHGFVVLLLFFFFPFGNERKKTTATCKTQRYEIETIHTSLISSTYKLLKTLVYNIVMISGSYFAALLLCKIYQTN